MTRVTAKAVVSVLVCGLDTRPAAGAVRVVPLRPHWAGLLAIPRRGEVPGTRSPGWQGQEQAGLRTGGVLATIRVASGRWLKAWALESGNPGTESDSAICWLCGLGKWLLS